MFGSVLSVVILPLCESKILRLCWAVAMGGQWALASPLTPCATQVPPDCLTFHNIYD